MLKLSRENFIKARDYIFANSDDISTAWYRYNFEGGDTGRFMDALAKYQYENGGFGGIYYWLDYRGPCLKTTEIAVGYILKLKEKPSAEHPVIQNMMKYILECYKPDEKACFAAFAALYSELVPEDLYRDIIKYPTEHILRRRDINSHYDFEYYLWFAYCLKNKNKDGDRDRETADKMTSVLCRKLAAFMELDYKKSEHGNFYLPCDLADSPDSVIYPAVKDLVDESLDYRMKQQRGDGRWPLGWSFGDSGAFRRLQILYEAYRTAGMLVKLERFGRIELNLT